MKEYYELDIDGKLLNKQIKSLLNAKVPEKIKTGLHNLLGEIYDQSVEIKKRQKTPTRNFMFDIFELAIQTADNEMLYEFRERLENEIARSECAIKEGFEKRKTIR